MREIILKEHIENLGGLSRQQAWELYCSLCNQIWIAKSYEKEPFKHWYNQPYLERDEDKYPHFLSYSWRAAGGFISEVAEGEDNYMSFYCCRGEGGVHEGMVTEFAKNFWETLGFKLFEEFYDRSDYTL
jgi:hypothetical protein